VLVSKIQKSLGIKGNKGVMQKGHTCSKVCSGASKIELPQKKVETHCIVIQSSGQSSVLF
jgi:hypothetical protein